MVMFRHQGSVQKDAAPLQSFVKRQNLGQYTPNPTLSAMSPNVPGSKNTAPWVAPAGKAARNMPFLEPMFMHLIGKYMGGK